MFSFLLTQVEIFSRQYSNFLLAIAIVGILILIFMRMADRNKKHLKIKSQQKSSVVITSQDIKAIAGDNVMATQLDLARAYIEVGKTTLAKKILQHVIDHGDATQQQMARTLLKNL